jgi:S-formylglutathione hydrolase FrmB
MIKLTRSSRVLFAFLALMVLLTLAVSAATITPEKVTHKSELLGVDKSFYVLPPRNYDPQKRYPVLYLLHGASGSYADWYKNTKLAEYLNNYDMFVVLPDGEKNGWYVDSTILPKSKYESYIPKELVPYIDSHYPSIADKTGRAICGLSMGGHGAITIAMKYPDIFGSASSLNGIMDIYRHPNEWDIAKKLDKQTKAKDAWLANSALKMVLGGKFPQGLSIFVSCGVNDFAIGENRDFHQALVLLGIDHSYVEHPGAHTWDYWNSHIEEHLLFHDRIFKQAVKK